MTLAKSALLFAWQKKSSTNDKIGTSASRQTMASHYPPNNMPVPGGPGMHPGAPGAPPGGAPGGGPGRDESYFTETKKGEVNELRQLLRTFGTERDKQRKRDIMKKVIAYMTLGVSCNCSCIVEFDTCVHIK